MAPVPPRLISISSVRHFKLRCSRVVEGLGLLGLGFSGLGLRVLGFRVVGLSVFGFQGSGGFGFQSFSQGCSWGLSSAQLERLGSFEPSFSSTASTPQARNVVIRCWNAGLSLILNLKAKNTCLALGGLGLKHPTTQGL